jgi:hypothetical protein
MPPRIPRRTRPHQQRNVLGALAQWWHLNGKHIETVIEIFAKSALRDPFLQVPVCGGNDPRVDADRARGCRAARFPSLRARAAAYLDVGGQVADLVEKIVERSASSKRPTCFTSAPVNAPFSRPNSSLSMRVSGIAPQLTLTSTARAARSFGGSCVANSSLPLPVSPSSRTVEFGHRDLPAPPPGPAAAPDCVRRRGAPGRVPHVATITLRPYGADRAHERTIAIM